jgi:hypothetical protein
MRWATVVILLLTLGTASRGYGDSLSGEVRRHFEAGTNAFRLGEFKNAVEEYKAAYKLKADPVFLYNIAQAYRLANDFDQALFFYRSYLHSQASAPNRPEVEERIHVLEEQLAQRRRLEQPPNSTETPGSEAAAAAREPKPQAKPAAPTPVAQPVVATTTPTADAAPSRAGSPRLRLAGLITGGVGVAALGAGVGLLVIARQAYDSQVHATDGTVFEPTAEARARTFQPVGIGLIAGGAALAIGGTTLFVIGRRGAGGGERQASLARSAHNGGAL